MCKGLGSTPRSVPTTISQIIMDSVLGGLNIIRISSFSNSLRNISVVGLGFFGFCLFFLIRKFIQLAWSLWSKLAFWAVVSLSVQFSKPLKCYLDSSQVSSLLGTVCSPSTLVQFSKHPMGYFGLVLCMHSAGEPQNFKYSFMGSFYCTPSFQRFPTPSQIPAALPLLCGPDSGCCASIPAFMLDCIKSWKGKREGVSLGAPYIPFHHRNPLPVSIIPGNRFPPLWILEGTWLLLPTPSLEFIAHP